MTTSSAARTLDFETLQNALKGGVAAIRAISKLAPAGGPGDKVFPPTYAGARYAYEDRWIDGEKRRTVLLDSVASQANRMEQAMLEAVRRNEMAMPLIEVDFASVPALSDLGKVTVLDAPHRIADAILRDSVYDDGKTKTLFRLSEPGRRFTNTSISNATALFELCPTALTFGVWDSTGPRGGLGAKFERALVSEIIGVDAIPGRRAAGRLDPLQIGADLGEEYTIYRHSRREEVWTFDTADAETDKGKPLKYGKSGKPSEINHGNVTPDLARAKETVRAPGGKVLTERDDELDGGVTIRYALQTTVLSLPALRRLRFPGGDAQKAEARDLAARTMLAAVAVAAVVRLREQGYHLRSRCDLVPEGPLVFEFVGADGGDPALYRVSWADTRKLLGQAAERVQQMELAWNATPIKLTPSEKLVKLAVRAREVAASAVQEPEPAGPK